MNTTENRNPETETLKFLPSLIRVIGLNGLAAVLVLGTSVLRLRAIFLAGIYLGRKGPGLPETPSGASCLGISGGPAGL